MYSEALRVLLFRDICLETTSDVRSTILLEEIGAQMNESQLSCASLFECSCPELDELATLARAAGAYGCRLTGKCINACTLTIYDYSIPSRL